MKLKIVNFIDKLFAKPIVDPWLWLENSEGADDLEIIEKSTHLLSNLINSDEYTDTERLEKALIIDEKNQLRLKDITKQFSKVEILKDELDKKTFNSAYYYYRYLFNLYQKLIINYFENHQKQILAHNRLPILFASAIHVAGKMIKWRLYLQQTPPDKLWLQVHILYQLATEESYLNQDIRIYKGEDSTSINAIYTYICMIDAMSTMNFSRQEVEFVATLLNQWLGKIQPDINFNNNLHVMMTDFSQDRGARRIRIAADNPNFLFWEVDDFCKKVSLTLDELYNHKTISEINVPVYFNISLVPEILKKLLAEWSKTEYKRQRRDEERFDISKIGRVDHGLEAVASKVRRTNQTNFNPLDLHIASASKAKIADVYDMGIGAENWQIVNKSPRGFGAVATAQPNTWVKQGALIALTFSGADKGTFVGVIRFNKQLKTNQFQIGIELFSSHSLYAQATHANSRTAFHAIYLPIEKGISITNSVILPRLEFKANSDYTFTMPDKTISISLGDAIETKADWTRAVCLTTI